MKNNNGKIAIAIVAMFVVALSIVGLTYAYFTASVVGNNANKSIEVTAGELVITYNNSNSVAAANIVPGWISDGKTFYDPVYSIKDFGGVRGVTAVKTSDFGAKEGEPTVAAEGKLAAAPSIETSAKTTIGEGEEAKEYSAYGLTDAATFNILNEGTDPAAFEVKLNVTTNIADKENVYVYLYEATTAEALEALNVSDTDVQATAKYKAALSTLSYTGNDASVVAIPNRTLTTDTAGKKTFYMLVVEYKEISGTQDASQNKSLYVEVEVNGLQQSATTVAAN